MPIRITKQGINIFIKPGYFISKEGDVFNVYSQGFAHKILKTKYISVYINTTSGGIYFYLHRLLMIAFNYPYDLALQVNHKDGNKQNNSLDNLEWVNSAENTLHARYNCLSRTGEACPWSILTEKEVREICELFSKKQNTKVEDVARYYGVHHNVIRDILVGNTWKEISIQYNIKYDQRAYFTVMEAHFICWMMELHNDKGFEYIYYLIIYFMQVENSSNMRKRLYKIWNKESFKNIASQYHFNEK